MMNSSQRLQKNNCWTKTGGFIFVGQRRCGFQGTGRTLKLHWVRFCPICPFICLSVCPLNTLLQDIISQNLLGGLPWTLGSILMFPRGWILTVLVTSIITWEPPSVKMMTCTQYLNIIWVDYLKIWKSYSCSQEDESCQFWCHHVPFPLVPPSGINLTCTQYLNIFWVDYHEIWTFMLPRGRILSVLMTSWSLLQQYHQSKWWLVHNIRTSFG